MTKRSPERLRLDGFLLTDESSLKKDLEMNKTLQSYIGKTIIHDAQPYGSSEILIERIEPRKDVCVPSSWGIIGPRMHFDIIGKVIDGKVTSRLFQHKITKDISGTPAKIYGVEMKELQKGLVITVAM